MRKWEECPRCLALLQEIEELKARNAKLADALAGTVRHSNTDLILGAVLSGGDPMALAKKLVEKKA